MLNREKLLTSRVDTENLRFRPLVGPARLGSPNERSRDIAKNGSVDAEFPPDTGQNHKSATTSPTVADRSAMQRDHWAWKHYQHACKYHWLPEQVDLAKDQAQWRAQHALTLDEREIVKQCLGFLSQTTQQAEQTGVLGLHRHISHPACRQYLSRQAFEEGLHRHAVWVLLRAFEWERPGPLHQSNDEQLQWLVKQVTPLKDETFSTLETGARQQLLRTLIATYVLQLGLFVPANIVQIASLSRRGKLCGTAKLLHFILCDQNRQLLFGVDLINQIKIDHPELWTEPLQQATAAQIREAVSLATSSAYASLPRGLLGLNAPMLEEYLRFLANRRCAQLGLAEPFPGASNPFPWLDIHGDSTKPRVDESNRTPTDTELDWNH